MSMRKLIQGDCREVMAAGTAESMDAIVTDPPYGLGFMGKGWDHGVPGEEFWADALRVLKPGGHLVAFGGTRTYHRLACAIEDAGFEIRDCLMWLYGTGFPKSLNVGKAMDKAAGVEFTSKPASGVGFMGPDGPGGYNVTRNQLTRSGESTDAAKQWEGWGTALKPAWEPIILARKPLVGTVAANVTEHGTGALNIDGCRVGVKGGCRGATKGQAEAAGSSLAGSADGSLNGLFATPVPGLGRWPANVVLDEDAGEMLDAQSGQSTSPTHTTQGASGRSGIYSPKAAGGRVSAPGDSGGASRFFYCAKASKKERGEGNNHPTVKPLALMRWLVRLITPPGGTVLDPFMGSGSTGVAALAEGMDFVGIEQAEEYLEIARRRLCES